LHGGNTELPSSQSGGRKCGMNCLWPAGMGYAIHEISANADSGFRVPFAISWKLGVLGGLAVKNTPHRRF
jgi:hypothetical protein